MTMAYRGLNRYAHILRSSFSEVAGGLAQEKTGRSGDSVRSRGKQSGRMRVLTRPLNGQ
jgi:hypothetical protein